MSDACSKSHLEMVRLVRFRTVSDEFVYMTGKRMRILIDMYGSWRLKVPWLWRIPPVSDLFRAFLFFSLLGVVPIVFFFFCFVGPVNSELGGS